MINLKFLPKEGLFEINEELLQVYRTLYNKNLGKVDWVEADNARKYAGLSLLAIKYSRGSKIRNTKEGFVYFITNPAWPNKVKVGLTGNYIKRLANYQTYDPYRSYKLIGWEFVTSKQDAELLILNKFQLDTDKGEWITYEDYLELITYLRCLINSPDIITVDELIGSVVYFNLPNEHRLQGTVLRRLKDSKIEVERIKPNGQKTKHPIHISQLSNKGPRKRFLTSYPNTDIMRLQNSGTVS